MGICSNEGRRARERGSRVDPLLTVQLDVFRFQLSKEVYHFLGQVFNTYRMGGDVCNGVIRYFLE